jgi:hypothetical protein
MRGRKSALKVVMDEATRAELVGWLRGQKTPVGLAKRAWAMLLLADGGSFVGVGRQVGMADRHVRKWAKRFLRDGPNGLRDGKRTGRPPVFSPRGGDTPGQDRVRDAG